MIKRIKTFCISHGWLMWSLFVALLTLLYWFAFLHEGGLNYFFNSDALYLPALYRDFFQDGYTLNGWTLNQAANFFPDMFLFFLLNAIFGNFVAATFWYAFVQYFTFIFLMYLIFRQIKPSLPSSTFAPAVLLFASFLFLLFIDERIWMSCLLNHNSYHNSPFIMSLLCIYLFFKYLNTKSWKILIVILILSMLCGACDKLFFLCFTIPVSLVIIVLYFINKDWKTLTKFLGAIAIGAIFAVVLWIIFKNNSYFSLTKPYGAFTLFYIKDSWAVLSQQMYDYLTEFSLVMFLTWFSLLSYIVVVIYVFVKSFKLFKGEKPDDYMYVFQLFVLFFTPIVLFAPVFAGSYDDNSSLRYNFFPYILLPFNLIVLISGWLSEIKISRITLNATLSLLMLGYLLYHFTIKDFKEGLHTFFNYYPERARIVDRCFSDDETLKYGVSDDYWAARQVTMFSKKGVRIYCTYAGGDPWLHVSNKHWFTDNDKGRHAHCEFTFFMWSKDKDVPVFFEENNELQPIDLERWNLYHVAPYRYIIPGVRFNVEPVLIDKSQLNVE